MVEEETPGHLLYCPRCDRPFVGKKLIDAWNRLIEHMRLAHPDYDPLWSEVG